MNLKKACLLVLLISLCQLAQATIRCADLFQKEVELQYAIFQAPLSKDLETANVATKIAEIPAELRTNPLVKTFLEKSGFERGLVLYHRPGTGLSLWKKSEFNNWLAVSQKIFDRDNVDSTLDSILAAARGEGRASNYMVEVAMAIAKGDVPAQWSWISSPARQRIERAFEADIVSEKSAQQIGFEVMRYRLAIKGDQQALEKLEADMFPNVAQNFRPPVKAPSELFELIYGESKTSSISPTFYDNTFQLVSGELAQHGLKSRVRNRILREAPSLNINFKLDVDRVMSRPETMVDPAVDSRTMDANTAQFLLQMLVREALYRRQMDFEAKYSATDPYRGMARDKFEDTLFLVAINPHLRPHFRRISEINFEVPLTPYNEGMLFPTLKVGLNIKALMDLLITNENSGAEAGRNIELRMAIENPRDAEFNLLEPGDIAVLKGHLQSFKKSLPPEVAKSIRIEVDDYFMHISMHSSAHPEVLINYYLNRFKTLPISNESIF